MSATEQNKPDALTRELWRVAGSGDVGRLEQVLAEGADVNASDRIGMTALMRAAYHGQLPVVRVLIEHGADLNAVDSGGLTALMVAKHAGREEIVNALAPCGAEATTKPTVHESPPVESPQEAVAATSKKVRTLHEPPEIWELVHTTQADSEHRSTAARPLVSTRTLDEPPEIWDLVHTTHAESEHRRTPARRLVSPRSVVLAASALIIVSGAWLGFMSLLGSEGATDATQVGREAAVNEKAPDPKTAQSSSNKGRSVENAKAADPKKAATPANQPLTTILPGYVTDFGRVEPTVPEAAPVALSEKKTVAKPRKNRTNTRIAFSSEREESTQKPPLRGLKSDSDQTDNSSVARKESIKAPSQTITEPVKANTAPKPKVIQWP